MSQNASAVVDTDKWAFWFNALEPRFGADTNWIPIKMKAIQIWLICVPVVVGGSGAVRSDRDAP